jgi:hypothetical protein
MRVARTLAFDAVALVSPVSTLASLVGSLLAIVRRSSVGDAPPIAPDILLPPK